MGRGIIVQRSQGNEVWFDWCKTKSDAIEQQFIHKVYKISDARCRFVADLVAAKNGLTKPKNAVLHHGRPESLTLERIEKRLKKVLDKIWTT